MMFASKVSRLGLLAACMALSTSTAFADWATQVIDLRPGWNAVFLEVQPESNQCADVFKEIPVRSVWTWNPRFPSAQYVQDPSDLLPERPEWLTYFPSDGPQGFLTDLYAVHAGRSYLIELSGEQGLPLVVSGRRRNREVKWMKDSFNLMGFHVDPHAPPSVQKFFAPSKAHAGQPVYRLTAAGAWEEITHDSTARLQPGEAYWVYCQGESTYAGPLDVALDWGEGLDYGTTGSERTIILKNNSDAMRTVRLRLQSPDRPTSSSDDAPASGRAADVALVYYDLRPEDITRKVLSWAPVSDDTTFVLDANSEREVRLAIRRADMPAPESRETVYRSVLEISDGAGSLYSVPVSARKSLSREGLWVGTATVKYVSEAGNPEDSVTPTRTASEFDFRIIVHRAANGQANLLQKVTLLQLQPVSGENPEDPDGPGIIVEPAEVVLLENDDLVPQYAARATDADGRLMGRRISAPAFGFSGPIIMTESQWVDDEQNAGQRLTCDVHMDYQDPLNPFVHRYHPDHDNLDDRYEAALREGKESFTFTRTITLDFEDEDPSGVTYPEWGATVQGGSYYEEIEGLHKNVIHVHGSFRLHLVSLVDELNDGAQLGG